MSFYCIVNTIAGSEVERLTWEDGPAYPSRAFILRNLLLPWLSAMQRFDRIVVVGEWEIGPGYDYVYVAPVYHDVSDLFVQRQAGFDHLPGTNPNDWFLYLNDDTLWDPANPVPALLEQTAVLSPSRWTRSRYPQGERINDGSKASSHWNDEDYVCFHGTLVKRWVTERIPWKQLPGGPGSDVLFTRMLAEHGVKWRYAPEYRIWDIEAGVKRWE